MKQVVIDNPVLNSPYTEPSCHFKFDDDGITDEIVAQRRISSYFIPIARPRKKGKQSTLFETEWTQDRIEENKLVNDIRQRVALWRKGGYVGVTPVTSRLLRYWTDPEREKMLFFCQIEALETAIYIAEAARKYDAWASPYSTFSRPFPAPPSGKIAVKVINHFVAEVLKVYTV